jgi:F-type H+-transporting ATPase subunit b
VRLRFETSPELISGIELVTSGQKLGWSIAEYLRALERETHAVLAAQAGPEPVDRHAA